jgi:hypothetical protein
MDPTLMARVTRFTGDGITGGSCLRIDTPAGDVSTTPAWLGPLQPGGAGLGSMKFWSQIALKIPASRLVKGTNPDGWKFAQVSHYNPQSPSSSRSNTLFEVVTLDTWMNGYPQAYHRTTAGEYPAFPTTLQKPWKPEVWRTFLLMIHAATYGGTAGNEFELWAQDPGEQPVLVSRETNFDFGPSVDSDGAPVPNGFSGLWLHAYESSGHAGAPATYQLWDQLIVSSQPIAWPGGTVTPPPPPPTPPPPPPPPPGPVPPPPPPPPPPVVVPDITVSKTGLKIKLPNGTTITT